MKNHPQIIFFIALSCFLFLSLNCKDEVVQPLATPVQLTAGNVSTTEVWLTIGFTGGGEFSISRNNTTILQGHFFGNDTTVLDDSLIPGKNYTYLGSKFENGKVTGTSSPLVIRTMDTTSHNFIWQTFTLGDGISSVVYDLAIVNDTLIYAVGKIYLKDSTGQFDPLPYNLAMWNGTTWKLQKVPYIYQSQPFYHPIQCVFVIDKNNIWFAGNGIQNWDGIQFKEIDLPISLWGQNKVNKIWGTNNTDLYIVGDGGSIAHYNGSSWTKIESGITLPINDIWGVTNTTSGATEIYLLASNKLSLPVGKSILKIVDGTVSTVADSGLPWSLSGIWFEANRVYYIVGDGMFKKYSTATNASWLAFHQGITTYYTEAIRGSALNDIVVAGDHGVILHYNGSTWKNYQNQTYLPTGLFYSIAIKGNIAVAAGANNANAVVAIGRR